MNVVRYRQWPATAVFERDASFWGAPLLRAANAASATAWQPAVDLREEAGQYLLYADVPGVDPQGIELEMDKDVLVLKGERSAPAAAIEGGQSYSERGSGSFERRFRLPENADTDAISAHAEHGVLQVRIPKRSAPGSRRIPVASGRVIHAGASAVDTAGADNA